MKQHPGSMMCGLHRRILVRDDSMPENTWRCPIGHSAQAIEARRAETLGSVHESAVRQDAPERNQP
jgi:hypothetical protein